MENIEEKFLNIHSNVLFESIKTFSNSGNENFSKEGSFFPEHFHFNNNSVDFIDYYNINNANIIGNSPIIWDNRVDINEHEENTSNNQQNNSKKKIENRNNNLTNLKTSSISQKTIPQSNSNKGKKKLGRKTKEEKAKQRECSSHDMYRGDNMSIKIQRHFLNFIIQSLNCIFPHCNHHKKLFNLNYEFKKNIKKENVESLFDKTIGDIISNKISEKYKSIKDKTNANKKICEEIKDPVLNKILSLNFLVFFKKFYFDTYSYINLKEYGLDKDIIFTKDVKNFKHFLKENKKIGDKYIMSIKRHVYKKYLPGSIFIC
jgi:hypothetical protein